MNTGNHHRYLMRVCKKCRQEKPIEEFYFNSRTNMRRMSRCKACVAATTQERRCRDLEKSREYERSRNRIRRASNPRYYWATAAFFTIRQRSAAKNLEMDLTREFLLSIAPTHCPVLGLEIDYTASKGKITDHSPSVDRIDNSLGYVKTNIAVICNRANRLKSDATPRELRRIADFVEGLQSKTN